MPDDLAAGGLQRGGPGVGGEVVLAGEPANVADLAQEGGGQDWSHAEQLEQAVLAWATAALMRASTAAIRCSSWRTSAASSVASCQRVTAGAPVGLTLASSPAARLAVRLRLARRGPGQPAAADAAG